MRESTIVEHSLSSTAIMRINTRVDSILAIGASSNKLLRTQNCAITNLQGPLVELALRVELL